MPRNATLLVLIKYPRPGRVKTRLAASLGAEVAAELYREWIGIVLGNLQPVRNDLRVFGFIDGAPAKEFQEWRHLVDGWLVQPEGDLGERLEGGFRMAHRAGGPVLAVGTDCLELDGDRVTEALASLQSHDAVFGPVVDGGYYLVGTARPLPGFFDDIRWSTANTFGDHLVRCRVRGWSVHRLPVLHDIDTEDDWQSYLCRSEGAVLDTSSMADQR